MSRLLLRTAFLIVVGGAHCSSPGIAFAADAFAQCKATHLTVFNWTKSPRSHTLKLADLGLAADHSFTATDVFDPSSAVLKGEGTLKAYPNLQDNRRFRDSADH